MQFNTFLFILLFLPFFLMGYYVLAKFSDKMAKGFLLFMSCIFYGYAGIEFLIILIGVMACNYAFILLLNKADEKQCCRKFLLAVAVTMDIVLLLCFKYYNFFIENMNNWIQTDFNMKVIILPLGISFFTFQEISYLVETYKGTTKTFSAWDYMIYILYFPKLLMGPLVMPQDLIPQINNRANRQVNAENMMQGIRMFNIGLFKKALLADTFSRAVTWGFDNILTATSGDFIVVMLAYTFQIYFDFSGYSDMAVGISKMINIGLPINFNSPYKALSLRDFWKRWHMSLTDFLTKYIYIPLGGSRKGRGRTYLNIVTVFLISGLWHGANWTFILWGLLHGVGQVLERVGANIYQKIYPVVRWLLTFIIVNVLWLLFRANSVGEWLYLLKHILALQNLNVSAELINCFSLPEITFLMYHFPFSYLNSVIRGFPMFGFLLVALAGCLCMENTYNRKYSKTFITSVISAIILVWSLISLSGEAVFVYNNF